MMKDPINKLIMEEIGLTTDKQQRVIDQDTRAALVFRNKNMRYSYNDSVPVSSGDVVFDPANNRRMTEKLFGYFSDKIKNEDGTEVEGFNQVETEDGKTALHVNIAGGTIIETKPYNSNALKYVDAMQQLNGCHNVDLTKYDREKTVAPEKGKSKRK